MSIPLVGILSIVIPLLSTILHLLTNYKIKVLILVNYDEVDTFLLTSSSPSQPSSPLYPPPSCQPYILQPSQHYLLTHSILLCVQKSLGHLVEGEGGSSQSTKFSHTLINKAPEFHWALAHPLTATKPN